MDSTILGNCNKSYQYTNLHDACDSQQYYNVYGVVINFVKPRQSKSPKASHKYYTSITIIDPSLPSCKDSVSVNLFSNDLEILPNVIQIGSIVRLHSVAFKYFNGARQLTGALYSNPKKGHGVSVLQCFRKTKDLTGIPLYCGHDGGDDINQGRREPLEVSDAQNNEQDFISYPIDGNVNVTNNANADECGREEGATNATSDAEAITINKRGEYYYFDPKEWSIVNKNTHQLNSFTVDDKKTLLQLSLWSQVLLMKHLNLHDGISQQEGIASTLYEAFKWEFTSIEGLNGSNTISNTTTPSLPIKIPKYDCICMVGYIRNATTVDGTNKQTCLYIYDGTGLDVHDHMNEACYQSAHILTLPKGDEEFIGPKTFQRVINRLYLSMKNAALYSECHTLEDRIHLEAYLEQGISMYDYEQDYESSNGDPLSKRQAQKAQVMYGHLYSIACYGEEERNYLDKLNLQPGTWLRIRNLHTSTAPTTTVGADEVTCIGIIKEDTSIGIIEPFFQNASACAAAHFHRLLEKQKYPVSKKKLGNGNATKKASGKDVAVTSNGASNNHSGNRTWISPLGVPYCPLISCLSSTPPGEFCVRARIKWYSPQLVRLIDTDTPVHWTRRNKSSTVTTKVPTYMFTLHIADDSAETDVIVYDKEGQFFLGGAKGPNATKFIGSEKLQEKAEKLLNETISSLTFIDFYLWTYKVQVSTNDNDHDANIGVLTSSYDDVENNSIANNEYARKHRYVTRVKLVHTSLVSNST